MRNSNIHSQANLSSIQTSLWAILSLSFLGLLLFVSFSPFVFQPISLATLNSFSLLQPSLGDLVCNALLFCPLAFCLGAWIDHSSVLPNGRKNLIFFVCFQCILISFVVEAGQLLVPGRIPSFFDFLSHSLGALGGVLAYELYSEFTRNCSVTFHEKRSFRERIAEIQPTTVVVCYLAYAGFVFLSYVRFSDAFRGLADPSLMIEQFFLLPNMSFENAHTLAFAEQVLSKGVIFSLLGVGGAICAYLLAEENIAISSAILLSANIVLVFTIELLQAGGSNNWASYEDILICTMAIFLGQLSASTLLSRLRSSLIVQPSNRL